MEHDYSENAEESRTRRKRFEKLLETLSPGLMLENVFGMNRFRWDGHDLTAPKSHTKFSSILTATSLLVMFVMFRIYPTGILGKPHEFNAFRELPTYLTFGYYWFDCILSASMHSESNIKIIRGIFNLDTALRLNLTDDYYKKALKENFNAILFLIIFHSIFQLTDIAIDGVLTVSGVLIIMVHIFQDLEILVFYKSLNMLKTRLNVLNDQLRKIKLKYENIENAVNTNEDDIAMKLYDLGMLYDDIGEVGSSINDIFNFQMLMILTSAFAYIIVIQWVALQFYKSNEDFAMNMARATIWCIRYVFSVSILCIACEKLLSERNDTKLLVNEIIMDYERPPRVRRQAKAFMKLLQAWELKISVYDMFFVDKTLVSKFVSVSTTYLIVLIQIYHFV